jgi:hypothetical protein
VYAGVAPEATTVAEPFAAVHIALVDDVTRLGAMNLLLHGIGPVNDEEGNVPIITTISKTVT